MTYIKPWAFKKVVLPQHTDHAGVMWHGAYLNWMEEGRIYALNKVGIPYERLSSQGYEMPVVSLDIKYKIALRHGEEVLIKTWFLPKKGAKLPCKVVFEKSKGAIAAISEVNLVLVRNNKGLHGLVRKFPENIEDFINSLIKGPCSDEKQNFN